MMKKLFIVFALLFVPTVIHAEQSTDCGCNAALAKDIISKSSSMSENQQYAFLNIIDSTMYEEYKHDASLTATIPIVDALIKGSANYSDFDKKRTEYFNKTEINYHYSKEQSYQEFQVITKDIAYTVWSECMRTCALKSNGGVFAWKRQEDENSVVVEVYWHGAPGAASKTLLLSTLDGGSVTGAAANSLFPKDTHILNNGSASTIIKRTKGKAIKATVSAAGATDMIYSAWATPDSTNSAKLILERPGVVETFVEKRCKTSGWSGSNSNKKCENGVCSPDGNWQASVLSVVLNAPQGHILRNPQFTRCWSFGFRAFGFACAAPIKLDGTIACEGGAECGAWWGVEGINTAPGESTTTGTFRAWSHMTDREFCADLIRQDVQTTKDEKTVKLPSKGTFTFEVQQGYSSAVLDYTIKGNKGVMKVGEKKSADGLLELVYSTQPIAGGTTYYQYKVN